MPNNPNTNSGRPYGGQNRGRYKQRGPRRNERIRATEIRVIGPNGTQIGVMPTQEALKLAKEAGLDLLEISPTARPPVCRILDVGKYMYEESKKNKGQKSSANKQKEVKFRLNIDTHDYDTKVNRARKFLEEGSKVKLTLSLRGREMQYQARGMEVIKRAIEDLKDSGNLDADPKLVGRNITTTLSSSQRKAKSKPQDSAS